VAGKLHNRRPDRHLLIIGWEPSAEWTIERTHACRAASDSCYFRSTIAGLGRT
jgi:hypothetical protein